MYLVSSGKNKLVTAEDGRLSLCFHPGIFWLGIALIVLGLAMPFYGIFHDQDSSVSGFVLTLLFWIFPAGCGYYLILWYRRHRVYYNDEGIEVFDWKNRSKKFKWRDIKSVKLQAMKSKYLLQLSSGETVNVHQYLQGIEPFLALVKSKISEQ